MIKSDSIKQDTYILYSQFKYRTLTNLLKSWFMTYRRHNCWWIFGGQRYEYRWWVSQLTDISAKLGSHNILCRRRDKYNSRNPSGSKTISQFEMSNKAKCKPLKTIENHSSKTWKTSMKQVHHYSHLNCPKSETALLIWDRLALTQLLLLTAIFLKLS